MPQASADEVPEVLQRFQRAVLGLGAFERPAPGMWRWHARGFAEGQAAIALLWPYLGAVKRAQATSALRTIVAQYGPGGDVAGRPRVAWPVRSPHAAHPSATGPSTTSSRARAWAAGFFDGEGWIGLVAAVRRQDGYRWRRLRASVSQKGDGSQSADVLLRLQDALGGRGRIEQHGRGGSFKWVAADRDAVTDVMRLIWPWLGSVKRAQARTAIDAFDAQPRAKGDRAHCLRGHARVLPSVTGPRRSACATCARLRDRARRAREGIPPRQFGNVARRYTE